MFNTEFSIQAYQSSNYKGLVNLLRQAARAHVHFDWQTPEECLENPDGVVYLGVNADKFVAALGISSPIENASWIRMIAVDYGVSVNPAIRRLWARAEDRLHHKDVKQLYVLLQERWLLRALEPLGFVPVDQVITLRHDPAEPMPSSSPPPVGLRLEPASAADMVVVRDIDEATFEPLWRLTERELQAAWRLADYFVVAWHNDQPAGYAIATIHQTGAHLARLATLPTLQGQGIGSALLRHMLRYCEAQGRSLITVNTQGSNEASQRLYRRYGFRHTGYDLPVLRLTLG